MLTCRWVPGTIDQVSLRTARHHAVVSVAHLRGVLGRAALEGLYLRGHYVITESSPDYWRALGLLFPSVDLPLAAD